MKSKFQSKLELEQLLARYSIDQIAEMYRVTPKTVYVSMERLGVDTPTGRHQGVKGGSEHWNWKGGRVVDGNGYIRVHRPEHPYADFIGYVLEHRLVMEEYLGRFLLPSEVVYHRNGVKDDNRISNLVLVIKYHE
jgi:hypothetical protein